MASLLLRDKVPAAGRQKNKAMKIGMAGAGLSCATIARELADAGHVIEIFEQRAHLAGNCHTVRDPQSQILLHTYGPHIFHTNDDLVWNYINRFADFKPYIHRVKAIVRGCVYDFPINLHTINQFFAKNFSPTEAKAFVESDVDSSIDSSNTFEQHAIRTVGRRLYDGFFKGYTKKQWGISPSDLPANLLSRLPMRFDYNNNYFFHRYQGLPAHGYTALVAKMLEHPNITIFLNQAFAKQLVPAYDHVFYSGTMDGYFNYDAGNLAYRTLDFQRIDAHGIYQGCAVMNYCDESVPHTRITEHKYFSPWDSFDRTVCYRELSRRCEAGDIPYYPIHLAQENSRLKQYTARAREEAKVTFVGRLGTYRYLDMDSAIGAALDVVRRFLERR